MTGVQIIIVRLESLPPSRHSRPELTSFFFCLFFHVLCLTASWSSSAIRFVWSLRASSRDISQSERFCNASMIYCTRRRFNFEVLKALLSFYLFYSFWSSTSPSLVESSLLPRNSFPHRHWLVPFHGRIQWYALSRINDMQVRVIVFGSLIKLTIISVCSIEEQNGRQR